MDISPDAPEDDEDLTVSYSFSDPNDGQSETGTQIIWYKNSIEQTQFENTSTIPHVWTNSSDSWYVEVSASDGMNRSTIEASDPVIIDNGVPSVDSLDISPLSPVTTDDLELSYTFSDPDLDPDLSWIRWYRDGVHVASYDNQSTLTSNATNYGEEWNATLLAYDGINWNSTLVVSPTVTIQNSPPEISNLQIIPSNPFVGQELHLDYDYFDADGHLESGTMIHWYKDGQYQPQYDGLSTINATELSAGETWHANVSISDGIDVTQEDQSNQVTIGSVDNGNLMDKLMKYLPYILGGVAIVTAVGIIIMKRKGRASKK
ncbi:hypothetical protein GF325_04440 [Candidatus Bathyarchaeota archaeon]|nr:hypothetical protein [Candidatus Bathyarchaeota archaeon]